MPSTKEGVTFRVVQAKVAVDDNNQVLHRPRSCDTFGAADIQVHPYHIRTTVESIPGATVTHLPCQLLEDCWESLHLPCDVKNKLLAYIHIRRELNSLCGCGGFVVLYGPPGTGKTTTARALAQKGAIRGGGHSLLMQMHCELFLSKFFGESAKNVSTAFQRVFEMARGPSRVFVLLDEVESIGLTRSRALSGSDAGDGIRVVNALLQGIDGLQELGNVVVLATSNLVNGLEQALMDRADMLIHLKEPVGSARVGVIMSTIDELIQKGVIIDTDNASRLKEIGAVKHALKKAAKLSGRRLRKAVLSALVKVKAQGRGKRRSGDNQFSYEFAGCHPRSHPRNGARSINGGGLWCYGGQSIAAWEDS